MMSEALQFGALGVLTLVLMGVGAGLIWYIKTTVQQQDEANKRLWALIESTRKTQEAQVGAWNQSMDQVTEILDAINKSLSDHDCKMADRHSRELEAIARLAHA